MINLIPNEEKKKTNKDFYLRFTSVFFIMLGFIFMVGSISILPSYFYTAVEKNLVKSKLSMDKTEDSERLAVVEKVADINNKINLVQGFAKNQFVFSEHIINEIAFKKIPGIKITEIYYENNKETGKKLNISGIAKDRETLLSFRRTLEKTATFSNVVLPISNFVQGSNIKFYLSLIPS